MMCEGRVAVVTGAAGNGMGRSIALTLAREGADVVVNWRASEREADGIVEAIRARGRDTIAVQADVLTKEGCERLITATVQRFGRVDILVIGPGAGWNPGPLEALDAEEALGDARSELAPMYHLLPRVLPGMYERRWGRIIALGLAPPYTSPAYSYSVGKAARSAAVELGWERLWAHGVTLNAVGPGPVPEIGTLDEAIEQCDHAPAWKDRATASPQDVAESIAFLSSEAGRFISGAVVPVRWHDA